MRPARRPRLGLAVPAWQAADFIAETLASALAQADVDVAVTVGIDGGDETTAAACQLFARDPRLRVIMRDKRLGWVENSNATLRDALARGADYVSILPHDDIIEPDYLASLLAAHRDTPGASVAYCDIQAFGRELVVVSLEGTTGPRIDRLENVLLRSFAGIPFRGLVPADILRRTMPLPRNPVDDFAIDIVWLLRLAAMGHLVRVPRTLYCKRYHDTNVHNAWANWPKDEFAAAWRAHCRQMAAEALAFARNRSEWRRLRAAAAWRFAETERLVGGYSDEARLAVLADMRAVERLRPSPARRLGWMLASLRRRDD